MVCGGVRTKCLRLGLPKQSTLFYYSWQLSDNYRYRCHTVLVLVPGKKQPKTRGGIYFASGFRYSKLFLPYLTILCFRVLPAWDRCLQQCCTSTCTIIPYKWPLRPPPSPSPSCPHNPDLKNSRFPKIHASTEDFLLFYRSNTYTLRYSTSTGTRTGAYIPKSQKSPWPESRSYPRFNFTCARVQYRKNSNNFQDIRVVSPRKV